MALLKKLPGLSSSYRIPRYYSSFTCIDENLYDNIARDWQIKKCEKSRKKLISSFLPLVKKIANLISKKNNEIDFEDIFSAGVLGLIRSIDKFDINKNYRLEPYATWWIKSSINEYIKNNWSQVKICTSESQRKLFSNYSKVLKDLKIENENNLNEKDLVLISKKINLSIKEIKNFQIRFQKDVYIGENEDFNFLNINSSHANDNNVEDIFFANEKKYFYKKFIKESLSILNKKEKYIIQSRFLSEKKNSREIIGKFLHISDERVRQIENTAKKKLLVFFQKNNIEKDLKNYL